MEGIVLKPKGILVDEEFRTLIPPLSPEEYAGLEKSLKEDGCRDALVVWDRYACPDVEMEKASEDGSEVYCKYCYKPVTVSLGDGNIQCDVCGYGLAPMDFIDILIDGHNRYEICTRLGIPYDIVQMQFDCRDDAIEWIIQNQLGRRNLTAFARAELALRLEPIFAARAKENQKAGGGGGKAGCQKSDKVLSAVDTKKEIAKEAGVSHDTIAKAKKIVAEASEETKAALRSGETSINAEYKKLTVHVGNNSGENEWYTPPEYIAAAREAMGGIDCDPASSEIANKTVCAPVFFTAETDGLAQTWGKRVWLNPPYAQPLMSQFASAVVTKFSAGEISDACVLVNNATETKWFQEMLSKASAVCFVAGRIKFVDMDGNATGAPLQGQAVLYFGERTVEFWSSFSKLGTVMYSVVT